MCAIICIMDDSLSPVAVWGGGELQNEFDGDDGRRLMCTDRMTL